MPRFCCGPAASGSDARIAVPLIVDVKVTVRGDIETPESRVFDNFGASPLACGTLFDAGAMEAADASMAWLVSGTAAIGDG